MTHAATKLTVFWERSSRKGVILRAIRLGGAAEPPGTGLA